MKISLLLSACHVVLFTKKKKRQAYCRSSYKIKLKKKKTNCLNWFVKIRSGNLVLFQSEKPKGLAI